MAKSRARRSSGSFFQIPAFLMSHHRFLSSLSWVLFDVLPKWNSPVGQTYLCRKESSMSRTTTCCSAVSWACDRLHIPSDFLRSASVHPWRGVILPCYANTAVGSLLVLALFASPCSVPPNAALLTFFPPDSHFSKSHHKNTCLCLGSLPVITPPFISLLSHLIYPLFFSLSYLSKTLLWRNCTYYSIVLTISAVPLASYLISKFRFSSWRSKTSPASPPLMSIYHISALISSYSQSVCFIDLALVIKEGVIFTFR